MPGLFSFREVPAVKAAYEKEQLGKECGDKLSLVWYNKEVGYALRTQTDTNSVFVSIGHKIDIQTAIDWVLKLSPKYRLPETTRHVDHSVNHVLKG